jgi:hypothetical protein
MPVVAHIRQNKGAEIITIRLSPVSASASAGLLILENICRFAVCASRTPEFLDLKNVHARTF